MKFSLLLALFALPAYSATVDRAESLRAARVWLAPEWIAEDFRFSSKLDVLAGPAAAEDDLKLLRDPVSCEFNAKALAKEVGGRTRKFYCELPQEKDSLIKVKYQFENGEISGELIGTRLLWALGFAADRMFFLPRLNCHGCTSDPWKDYRVNIWSKFFPVKFENVAVERKFEGKEIKIKKDGGKYEGWSFGELMRLLPEEQSAKSKAEVEREALRLLSIFLMHADNKDENQSLLCLGKKTDSGGCSGETLLMIHDLGSTFGKGFDGEDASKTDLKGWSDSVIWSNPGECIANLGRNSAPEMIETAIREEGREFLAKLLKGFSEGAEGRERVKDLFGAGRGDLRSATIDEWADVFLRKVEEIAFPLGRAAPEFKCPQGF